MNKGRNGIGEPKTDGDVLWTVAERDDHVHAVADVPNGVPKQELGIGASDTGATIFVGTPAGPSWPVEFPTTVKPAPVDVTYNNGIVELVFALDPAPVKEADAAE